jgi:hypothetical protein
MKNNSCIFRFWEVFNNDSFNRVEFDAVKKEQDNKTRTQ